ncbi:MAG: exonuclease domain-containing protein [Solirubrobacteraceae bacterium]
MSWVSGRLAAFDIETTGVEVQTARLVSAAVLLLYDGQTVDETFWLVNPGVAIPAAATRVHGITTQRAQAEGVSPALAVSQITDILADQTRQGVAIVVFNARFDLTVLDREARRHGVATLLSRVGGEGRLRVVDPLVLDRQLDRYRPGKRTLGAVCAHYGVALQDAHAASGDALAAALLAVRLGAAFPDVGRTDLEVLHRQQMVWAVEQAASLEQYFRKK